MVYVVALDELASRRGTPLGFTLDQRVDVMLELVLKEVDPLECIVEHVASIRWRVDGEGRDISTLQTKSNQANH